MVYPVLAEFFILFLRLKKAIGLGAVPTGFIIPKSLVNKYKKPQI